MFFLIEKKNFKNDKKFQSIFQKSKEILGKSGRLLIRQSGTEPCVRIMIEGKNYFQIKKIAHNISDVLKLI